MTIESPRTPDQNPTYHPATLFLDSLPPATGNAILYKHLGKGTFLPTHSILARGSYAIASLKLDDNSAELELANLVVVGPMERGWDFDILSSATHLISS
jgi:hypothetical protein